jgi:putative oxidoreductase
MRGIGGVDPAWGITAVRVAAALVFIVHGYQKFAGGLDKVAGFFAKLAIPLPGLMAPFIAILELGGGILLLIGLATRWLGLLYALEMIVVVFWVTLPARGWEEAEFPLMLLASGILFFLAGPGKVGVDELWLDRPA